MAEAAYIGFIKQQGKERDRKRPNVQKTDKKKERERQNCVGIGEGERKRRMKDVVIDGLCCKEKKTAQGQ